jgi:hypothetical protein
MTPIRQSTGRLIIAHAGQTASVFLTAAHAPSIEALLADIRRHIYREPRGEARPARRRPKP